ncbi:MarR family winged helix-turn-helix transcriptional regulator [Kordiimonas sp.]|uniref:MarR family winged helix-turn-helix transcriptional regulator n=1 Tax=Kordiimonas sp. TaxID=1970157 RepID=UPI003A8E9AF1
MSANKHRLYLRLQLAAHQLKKHADRALLDSASITTAQAAVLSILKNEGQASQRTIADALGQNESAVTAMVKRLLKLGYVERNRSDLDGRAWVLTLTEGGKMALEQVSEPFLDVNTILDEVLDSGEAAKLADYLDRISRAFKAG